MDLYPEELRTPPMPLVALVGMPELHSAVSMSLHKEEPPLNTLAIPDISKISIIGGKERKAPDARMPPPVGILKADWLAKHRTRSAAVLACLLSCDQVCGDHSQWLQLCSSIDTIKSVIRGRNTKLVIAVVQPSLNGETNETRLTVLRKRAEVDAKNVFVFITHDPGELKRSLLRLGIIMGELAQLYYKEEGRRIQNRIERKLYSSAELSIRYNFKVAVYAEFRRKWVKALKFYETAYSLLQEVLKAHMEVLPLQRTVELKAVAEHVHFKISTLLLHSGKEGEAVKWFRQHVVRYKCLIGPPEGAFLHWSWVCRQFQVFAELLDSSLASASTSPTAESSPGTPLTSRELQPGYYLQVAASYMVLRRRFFESALASMEAFEEGGVDFLSGPKEEIGPPLYVGQAPRLLRRGNNFDAQRPTEAEFMRHVIAVEKSFAHSHETITLLTRAQQHFREMQAVRMISQLGGEMGREYYNSREYEQAKGQFDSVAATYRREAWVAILGATLGYLRECARQLGQLQAYVEYALELSSLPVPATLGQGVQHMVVSGPEVGPAGPLSQFLREQVHKEVIGLMQGTASVLPAREDENGMAVTSEQPVALEIDLQSPLRSFLSACVVFHEQIVKPGVKTYMTLSLLTHLPSSLELLELEVHFNQPECSFVLKNSKEAPQNEEVPLSEGLAVKEHDHLELEPDKWKRLTVDITPNLSGKFECLAVVARVGPHATVRCVVDGPAFRNGNPLWNYEPGMDTLPVKPSNLTYFGQKTLLVEEAEPLVHIELEASGPALVGEAFPVRVVVTSTGHPMQGGEMDVYLGSSNQPPASAASPGGKVPLTTAKSGAAPPELLRAVAGAEGGEGYVEFSGPVQLPSLEPDETWETTVYLRWCEPKDVNLMVLLHYQSKDSLTSDEAGTPAYRRRVQKILQLRGEEALDVSSQYVSRFRRDALLPCSLAAQQPQPAVTLPVDEATILVVTAKNSSSLAVNLRSFKVLEKDAEVWSVRKSGSGGDSGGILLSPEEVYEQLFYVRPLVPSSSVEVGTIEIVWQREQSQHETSNLSRAADIPAAESGTPPPSPVISICRLFALAPVAVESPPLVVTFKCPPHALLGVPFVCSMSVQNTTTNLQELSFSVYDTQSFIFAGAHSDTFSILPKSTNVLSYKLVPIASGMQPLPQLRFTSTRYNAGFQPSALSTQLFVHPSAPSPSVDPQKKCQPDSGKLGIAVVN